MPVYNRYKIVSRAIESVIVQTYPYWQLIIVDDGSTDITFDVISDYEKKDSRIKVYRTSNKGASAARNVALNSVHNSCDYILFLDSDDAYCDNLLEVLTIAIMENPADILCYGIYWNEYPWNYNESICNKVMGKEDILGKILPEHINICPKTAYFLQPYIWNKCFKFDLIDKNNIRFDEFRKVWNDNAFCVEAISSADYIVVVDKPLCINLGFSSGDNISKNYSEHMIEVFIKSYVVYTRKFGNLYNFNNDYTNRFYFMTFCDILYKLKLKYSKDDLVKIIQRFKKEQNVLMWISNYKPKNSKERRLSKSFINQDDLCIYKSLYDQQTKESYIVNGINKCKRLIKRVIKK